MVALKVRISNLEQHYQSELQRERLMHRKFNEQSERVKQTLVDEINKMELQHQSKLNNLEVQIADLKKKNRSFKRKKEMEMNQLSKKLTSEIDKERNIATIMVEDLDEEKTRLVQEMEEIKEEYESKLAEQKKQLDRLREVAEDALSYGKEAVNASNKRPSIEHDLQEQLMLKDQIINEMRMKLRSHNKLKQSKKMLEKQVLNLSQQILDTFANNLDPQIREKINL